MPDVSAKIKGLNIEFNDNLINSPNIESGDDIKTSFARIHKRFSQMKSAAYIDASISNNKTITLGDSNIGVVSISQNQGLTDIEKTNARTNIGAGTSNFNGSFNSLTDKPTTIAGYGITDAFSGSFTDLTNKPTTISGYGITDAKIQNGTITLGSNTIKPITSFSSLDSPLVGGSGKYISSISETDGIISATETTLDTVPTENSTNAITSGAVYTDSANQQLEINYAINTGAKNLFPITAVSQTIGGITFTVNDDGTVTANGTKTNNDWFMLSVNNSFDAGTYTLSDGLPNDITGCMLIITTAESLGAAIMGTETNRRTHTKTFTTAQTGLYYAMRISSGTTVNNLTFKPMLRRAEITDSTYEPYAPTNRELYETMQKQALRYEDSRIIRLNQLSWSQTASGAGMWIADCYTTQSIDTIVSVVITSFSQLKPAEITTLFTYIPSSVSGMHTVRLICDRDLTGISSNSTLYLRVFGYGYQTASSRMLSFNSPMTLNLDRNDLNESLDTGLESLDSIPEEESESYNIDEELTEEEESE